MKHLLLIMTFLSISTSGYAQAGDDYRYASVEQICECWGKISLGLDQKTIVQKTDKCMKEGISRYADWWKADEGITVEMNTDELMQNLYGFFTGTCSNLYLNLRRMVNDEASNNQNDSSNSGSSAKSSSPPSYLTEIAKQTCDCFDQISATMNKAEQEKEMINCLNNAIKEHFSSVKMDYDFNEIEEQRRLSNDISKEMATVCSVRSDHSSNSGNSLKKQTRPDTDNNTQPYVKQMNSGLEMDKVRDRRAGIEFYNELESYKDKYEYYAIVYKFYQNGKPLEYQKRPEYGSLQENVRVNDLLQRYPNFNLVIRSGNHPDSKPKPLGLTGSLAFGGGDNEDNSSSKDKSKQPDGNDSPKELTLGIFLPYDELDLFLSKGTNNIEVRMNLVRGLSLKLGDDEYFIPERKNDEYIMSLGSLNFTYTKH